MKVPDWKSRSTLKGCTALITPACAMFFRSIAGHSGAAASQPRASLPEDFTEMYLLPPSWCVSASLFVLTAILAAGVGFGVRGGIFGTWAAEFGFTGAQLGMIGGAGFTSFCFDIMIGGVLVDKFGCGKLVFAAFAQLSLYLIPTVVYGAMFFGQKYPKSEASEKGLKFGEMLKDVGLLGGAVVSFMLYLFFKGLLTPFFEKPVIGTVLSSVIAISLMGGIGMMSAGLIGGPGLGYFKHRFAAEELAQRDAAIHAEWTAGDNTSKFLAFKEVDVIDPTRLETAKITAKSSPPPSPMAPQIPTT